MAEEDGTSPDQGQSKIEPGMNNSFEQAQDQSRENTLGLGTTLSQGDPSLQIVQPSPVSGIQTNALNSNSNQCKLQVMMTQL